MSRIGEVGSVMNGWILSRVVVCRARIAPISLCWLLLGGFAGCASAPGVGVSDRDVPIVVATLQPLDVEGAVSLRLGAETGRSERMKHASRVVAKSYEMGRPRTREENLVGFESRTEIRGMEDGTISQAVTTSEKKGEIDLHSLALPEIGETLELRLMPHGQVLHAGGYPKDSVFYVPPILLPSGLVEVGDTWSSTAEWVSAEERTPFQMEMVGVLKGFVACGSDQCADIELSGEVRLPFELRQLIAFDSEWRGRMLFARHSGSLVWSRIDSLETMRTEGATRRVHSCLESALIEPTEIRLESIAEPSCEESQAPPAFRDTPVEGGN